MNNILKLSAACLIGFTVIGCSIGDAPATLTPEQTQEAVKALPPQQQIDYINRSPMPPAEKAKRIAEIKEKAGLK